MCWYSSFGTSDLTHHSSNHSKSHLPEGLRWQLAQPGLEHVEEVLDGLEPGRVLGTKNDMCVHPPGRLQNGVVLVQRRIVEVEHNLLLVLRISEPQTAQGPVEEVFKHGRVHAALDDLHSYDSVECDGRSQTLREGLLAGRSEVLAQPGNVGSVICFRWLVSEPDGLYLSNRLAVIAQDLLASKVRQGCFLRYRDLLTAGIISITTAGVIRLLKQPLLGSSSKPTRLPHVCIRRLPHWLRTFVLSDRALGPPRWSRWFESTGLDDRVLLSKASLAIEDDTMAMCLVNADSASLPPLTRAQVIAEGALVDADELDLVVEELGNEPRHPLPLLVEQWV